MGSGVHACGSQQGVVANGESEEIKAHGRIRVSKRVSIVFDEPAEKTRT